MRKSGLIVILLCAAALAAQGQIIPTNVPPVKLFDELNYDLPELAKVKAAVDAADVERAKVELLAHFRTRTEAQKPRPNPKPDTRLADNLLLGKFIWGKTECSYGPRIEDIEWYKVPAGVDWVLFDHELGRHTFVTPLVSAYRNTGDEKYARHLIGMLLDYIKKCPVEDGRRMPEIDNMDTRAWKELGVERLTTQGHPSMQWEEITSARALQQWPSVLQYCIHSEAMTPDVLVQLLTSMIERERYLVDALPFTSLGNHGTRTPTAVLEVAAKLPEIKERRQWADRTKAELLRRYNWYGPDRPYGFIYRDGSSVEIAPLVVGDDYNNLLDVMEWLKLLGQAVPEQFVEIRKKMIEYLAYSAWPGDFERRSRRPEWLTGIPELSNLDYILSGGTKGTPPKQASYPLCSGEDCYGGTYFMRSGWSGDAVVLRVRFGPIQYEYSQFGLGDIGNIGVWGYGMPLLPHLYSHPRTGPYPMYGDRSFQGNGRSDNTISVDGVSQDRANRIRRADKPLDNPWVTTPAFDYVRGSYTFDQKRIKAVHTRAILFLKPDYFLVMDRVDGDDKVHQYRMKYHLHHELDAHADGVQATGRKGGKPLIVVATSRSDLKSSIVKDQMAPPYEGWHLSVDEGATPGFATIYAWEQPAPARVETVIWPVRPDGPSRMEVTRAVKDGVITLTVTRGNLVDMISCGGGDSVTFHRWDAGHIAAAGMVGAMSVETNGLALRASRPGSAYLMLDKEGHSMASSNCGANISLQGCKVQMVPWEGR